MGGCQTMTMQVAVSTSRVFIRLIRQILVLVKYFMDNPLGACGIDHPMAPMFELYEESAGVLQSAHLSGILRKLGVRWCTSYKWTADLD